MLVIGSLRAAEWARRNGSEQFKRLAAPECVAGNTGEEFQGPLKYRLCLFQQTSFWGASLLRTMLFKFFSRLKLV